MVSPLKHPAISDVRETKVAALRKAIAAGTYKPDTRNLTDKLIETMLRKPQ